MDPESAGSVRSSYNRIAAAYTRDIAGELAQKPFDRQLLNRFAAKVADRGQVCEIGCGPGHVARFLSDAGVSVFGLDLSPGMLKCARRLHPDIEFREGNMRSLDMPSESLAGLVAFYSIVHFSEQQLPDVFLEMHRVLQPEGWLLLSFHCGDQVMHRDEMWKHPVSLDFHFFQPSAIVGHLEKSGFTVHEMVERDPYAPGVEFQSRRAYIFAQR
jgi:ubiquinone/menaquinone biosynthesis C-methylase UbiE